MYCLNDFKPKQNKHINLQGFVDNGFLIVFKTSSEFLVIEENQNELLRAYQQDRPSLCNIQGK